VKVSNPALPWYAPMPLDPTPPKGSSSTLSSIHMIIYQPNSALLTKYLFKHLFEANQWLNIFPIRSHVHHIQTHLILWSEEA
jgi:hypothetical protein